MIPLQTHQVWFGQPMPEKLAALRADMMAKSPLLEHRLWHEGNIHELGLNLADLCEQYPTLAGVSNAVRLKALLDHGGCYLDVDYLHLKPLYPFFELNGPAACHQEGDRFCNAFAVARKGEPWIKWQWDRIAEYRGVPAYWGVDLMTSAPRDGLTIVPRDLVFPWLFDDPPEKHIVKPWTIIAHLWEKSWVPKPQ